MEKNINKNEVAKKLTKICIKRSQGRCLTEQTEQNIYNRINSNIEEILQKAQNARDPHDLIFIERELSGFWCCIVKEDIDKAV